MLAVAMVYGGGRDGSFIDSLWLVPMLYVD